VSDLPEAAETIGTRLRRLREERGLSQRSLASPGIGYAYISRVERGDRRPSLKALRQLAGKLGVTVEYLETGADVAPGEARELKLGEAELALRLDCDVESAERALEEVVADALAHGDLRDAARARIGLGMVAAHRGEHARAIELLEAAARERWVTPVSHPNVFATLGHSYICTGDPTRAAALLRGALEVVLATAAVERATVVRYATYLSYALADAGDLAGARAALDQALAHGRTIDDPYTRVRIFWSNARLASLDGDPDLARLSINRAIGLLESTEDTVYLGRAHLLAAEIALTEKDHGAAREHLDDAALLVDGSSVLMDQAWLRVQQALLEARTGDASAAIDRATEAIELLAEDDDRTLRGCGHWALGEALAAAGAEGAARKAFRDASALIDPDDKYAGPFVEAWQKLFPADVDVR
jgi:transcriptional regulator with XRE-family HTH domain